MMPSPSGAPTDEGVRLLILAWTRRARRAQLGHAYAATSMRRRARALGATAAILATVVGSSLFVTIGDSPDAPWPLIAALLSIAAAVCATLQTSLHPGEGVRRHKTASRRFGAIRRELGELGTFGSLDGTSVHECIDKIRTRYDAVSKKSPNIPRRAWKRAKKERKDKKPYVPLEFAEWPEVSKISVDPGD